MAAVMADGAATAQAIESLGLKVVAANLNGPNQTIVAGSLSEIEAAVEKLSAAGLRAKRIPVGGAFHTPAMADAAQELGRSLAAIDFAAARDEGLAHLDEIAATYARATGLPAAEMREYLSTNISFELDEELLAGLELYFQLAQKHGLIPEVRPLRFAGSGS